MGRHRTCRRRARRGTADRVYARRSHDDTSCRRTARLTGADALISVLSPSFNQGRFIRDTLESVARQDYPRVEHIVADGGSTDETLSILAEYAGRTNVLSEPDGGQAEALNKAFARSRGSIVGWLNSDDFYLWDGVLTRVATVFAANPSVDVVYGHAVWVDEENRVLKTYPRPAYSAERLARFDYISQPATFVRREAVGPRLVDPALSYALDYGLWLRLLRNGSRFVRCSDYLAAMRYHPAAKSVRARADAWAEDLRLRGDESQRDRNRSASRAARDLGVMAALKLRGLVDYRPAALHAGRWTVELRLPPPLARPLYQTGLRGADGSAGLLPRYFLYLARHAKQ